MSGILDRVNSLYQELNRWPNVVVFGLTYKPNVDDVRESPAVEVARSLLQGGLRVVGVDPHVSCDLDIPVTEPEEIVSNGDLAVVLVNHDEFSTDRFLKIFENLETLRFV